MVEFTPGSVDPLLLPSKPLEDCETFPAIPAIYFVISESDEIIYIGKANNLLIRWRGSHHRKRQFSKLRVRIAWLEFTDTSPLKLAEIALIETFKPTLNGLRIPDEDRGFDGGGDRFQVTLPKGVADGLRRWAVSEENKPSTLISFLVEKEVRAAMADGRIPKATEPLPTQKSDKKAMLERVKQFCATMLEAQLPEEGQIQLIAHLMDMTPAVLQDRLEELILRANGTQ